MKIALLIIAMAVALTAQETMEGDVVDGLTGAPIAGVRVARPGTSEIAISDAAGHFTFTLRDGQISLLLNRPGYLPMRNAWIKIVGNADSVRLRMTPQAVISGKVEDEDGFPVAGAEVEAYHYTYLYGRGQLRYVGRSMPADEAGQYRIFELPEGSYYVRVVSKRNAAWDARYGPQFYPDATDPSRATLVEATAGQERGNVDIRLTRKEGVTVTGKLVLPKGSPQPRITLQAKEEPRFPSLRALETRYTSDTEFEFTHVPAGAYKLSTDAPNLNPKLGDLTGTQTVEVGRSDVRDVVFDLHPLQAMDLAGKVVFETGATPAPVTVILQGNRPDRQSATTQSDGSFVVHGVLPGEYGIWVTGVPAQTLSIRVGEREVRDSGFEIGPGNPGPVEIHMGPWGTAKFRGNVVDAAGHGVAAVLMCLRAVGSDTLVRMLSASDGSIANDQVPPGDYHLFLPPSEWATAYFDDPDYRKAHENDFPIVHLSAGENGPVRISLGK